jgi:hypothetical protein
MEGLRLAGGNYVANASRQRLPVALTGMLNIARIRFIEF